MCLHMGLETHEIAWWSDVDVKKTDNQRISTAALSGQTHEGLK